MRLFSLLPMTLAAIFFAGSVSAHHKCGKGNSMGAKVYQVCKSWRVDQGGPMPTNMMQHCRNVLCEFSEDNSNNLMSCGRQGRDSGAGVRYNATCVNDNAREKAKNALGYW